MPADEKRARGPASASDSKEPSQVRTRLSAGGSRIRPLGPALHTHRFGPPSCRPRDGPVRHTEITRWRPGTKRSTPASAAEYTATACGLSAGALPGWRDLHPSAYGHAAGEVVRARAITAMVLRLRLQNHVEGRLRRAPDALEAARPDYLANPRAARCRAPWSAAIFGHIREILPDQGRAEDAEPSENRWPRPTATRREARSGIGRATVMPAAGATSSRLTTLRAL